MQHDEKAHAESRMRLLFAYSMPACRISGRKYRRVGIVAGLMNGKIVAPLEYEGTMDSTLFEKWFAQHLLPAVGADAVIVMDNASFHRKKQLICAAKNSGCRMLFLPPY